MKRSLREEESEVDFQKRTTVREEGNEGNKDEVRDEVQEQVYQEKNEYCTETLVPEEKTRGILNYAKELKNSENSY